MMLKIAVTGKGGVGKTSFTALLARRLADRGRRVLAVDADPDANLADSLNFPSPESITPISDMKEMIFDRMGTSPGSVGTFFKLNPKVSDIPEKFCLDNDGIRLIVMGMVKRGGQGCACPENAFIKVLLSHILLGPDEDVLVDMEAGLEHLGRGTVSAVDGLVVVVEPTLRSLDTLNRILKLAKDLGIKRCWPVANKIESDDDKEFLTESAPDCDFVGWMPYSKDVVKANRGQISIRQVEAAVWDELDRVLARMADDVGKESCRPVGSDRRSF